MPNEYSPPPWLIPMQRYGPPPSYPNARIPGLNAPLPAGASYGYHVGGWGKPPVDAFGRPLYGGDPFGKPEELSGRNGGGGGNNGEEEMEDLYGLGSGTAAAAGGGGVVTSDGKVVSKRAWGALPNAFGDDVDRDNRENDEDDEDDSSEEEDSSADEMDESEEEDGQEAEGGGVAKDAGAAAGVTTSGMHSVLPDGVDSVVPSSAIDLRKQPGDETPMVGATAAAVAAASSGPPKQLYTVLQQAATDKDSQQTSVFASDHTYVLPGAGPGSGMPEGAASVLSKANVAGDGSAGKGGGKGGRSKKDEEEEAEELAKKYKF